MYKSASNADLSRVQPARHATSPTLHSGVRLVQAMSAWSVKTRRTPIRRCWDVRVYGHTTTTVHDVSTSLPPVRSNERPNLGGLYRLSLIHI